MLNMVGYFRDHNHETPIQLKLGLNASNNGKGPSANWTRQNPVTMFILLRNRATLFHDPIGNLMLSSYYPNSLTTISL